MLELSLTIGPAERSAAVVNAYIKIILMPAVVRLVATWVLLTTLSAGQEPRGPKPREDFAQLAEGVTSPTKRDTIEAGYRMFSAPDFGATCAQAHAQDVKRLEAVSSRPRLRVGHEFDPSQLKMVGLLSRIRPFSAPTYD